LDFDDNQDEFNNIEFPQRKEYPLEIVDLSHLMNVHTPGWVGYAGNQMYYAQNLQTKRIVAQRIDTALHVGTHIDGAMHGTDGMGDMASYPLDFLVGPGAVVDVSKHMDDWAVITPEMIEEAPVKVKDGDILIIHTGWHRYWEGQPQQDLVRYFCMHPGGNLALLEWMLKKKIKWFGIDCGSGDHAMNTSIREKRQVVDNVFPFHSYAFDRGLIHAENVGGDIELMLNQRAIIGAFPWRYDGLEACPCRIVCFKGMDESVKATGDAAKAVLGMRRGGSSPLGGHDGR
jgi:kynurenine formamidase